MMQLCPFIALPTFHEADEAVLWRPFLGCLLPIPNPERTGYQGDGLPGDPRGVVATPIDRS